MGELEKLIQELNAKISAGTQLSKEDVTKFLELSGAKAQSGKQLPFMQSADQKAMFDAIINDPSFQKVAEAQAKSRNISAIATAGLNMAVGLMDMSTGANQVREAYDAIAQAKKPTAPARVPIDPLQRQRINQALRGTLDVNTQLAPARQELFDQYLQDINTAKTASGGQASTFGALGQVASMRRGRGALGLAPLSQQIRSQNAQELDALLSEQQNQLFRQRALDTQLYGLDLDQYNNQLTAAGQLAATGQINRRNALGGVLNTLTSLPGQLTITPRAPRQTGFESYGSEIANYANKVNDDLANDYRRLYSSQGW